jgi:hypothetical protein
MHHFHRNQKGNTGTLIVQIDLARTVSQNSCPPHSAIKGSSGQDMTRIVLERTPNVPARTLSVPTRILNVPERILNIPARTLNVPEKTLNVPARILNVPERTLNVLGETLNVCARILKKLRTNHSRKQWVDVILDTAVSQVQITSLQQLK